MQKRRKALTGKTVTVDSTVEGGMVFQEPVPKVVLVREPRMRVDGRAVEDMEEFDPQCVVVVVLEVLEVLLWCSLLLLLHIQLHSHVATRVARL